MNNFLSCDWGTSSFRLRHAESPSFKYVSVDNTAQGIANTFEQWKQTGKKETERFSFYLDIIDHHIFLLEQQLGFSVKGLPLIISGMASSSMGMMELPYKKAPFMADGSDLEWIKIKGTHHFDHDILLISGASTNNDVMRGEETQLAGVVHDLQDEALFVFPGTHSKHVQVKNGRVVNFQTYMTGEFFDLLSKKSILSNAIGNGGDSEMPANKESFEKGISASTQSNLLHNSFLVRTNDLFKKHSKQENYYYLSGLLIGTEIGEMIKEPWEKIVLVADGELRLVYQRALVWLQLRRDSITIGMENPINAVLKGQVMAWNNSNK